MSNYYETTYQRRLNRYGLNFQSRIQNQRERDFDQYLYKTIYRVDFEFDGEYVPASLEHSKQDYSETQASLLTKRDVKIPNGTVLMLESQDGTVTPWMVWWLEQVEAKGYNTYTVLKMTHYLTWTCDGEEYSQWVSFRGPGSKSIIDSVVSSTGRPVYSENDNLYTFITKANKAIKKDTYFEINQDGIVQGYVVKEFDINSTPGVIYVTADPVITKTEEKPIVAEPEDSKEDFYWLNGGAN